MVNKNEQEKINLESKTNFSHLKHSIQKFSDKQTVKQELLKLKQEVNSLDEIMKEQIQRVHGNMILDMNLDKGRFKEEIRELEQKLAQVRASVDSEVKIVVDDVHHIKNDLKSSMSREFLFCYWLIITEMIFASFCFFIGLINLFVDVVNFRLQGVLVEKSRKKVILLI